MGAYFFQSFGVFLAQKLNNKPFTVVGDGTQTRDFTYVSDVVNAFYKASLSDITCEIMNVGSGNHYSINEIAELLDGEKVFIPKRPAEPDYTFADITKIKKRIPKRIRQAWAYKKIKLLKNDMDTFLRDIIQLSESNKEFMIVKNYFEDFMRKYEVPIGATTDSQEVIV